MHIDTNPKAPATTIAALFQETFTASENASEGALVGALAGRLLTEVPAPDRVVVTAQEGDVLTGAVVFTRMRYPEAEACVFLLSPMAIATAHQGRGLGQQLITAGLTHLRQNGVDVVLTYGDIRFYARVGFAQITEEIARAPQPLSYPDGWLGQSLTGEALGPLAGPGQCVAPFDDPAYW
ncbi:GNAT family N-acetyltransferase [Primorskyibacter sp. S187A]|uniref:GNAT family N-acetyltransferase n=1 Tax=Primorskyibacter sp. S187A TaxID=3415130 RepID=UPI003C7E5F18